MMTTSPWPSSGTRTSPTYASKRVSVDSAVNHKRGHDAAPAQARHKGRRFPMAVRHAGPEALTAGRSSVAPGHAGRGPGLVDEHQTFRVEIELALEPLFATLQDVRTVLLGGVGRLFLRVMAWRRK